MQTIFSSSWSSLKLYWSLYAFWVFKIYWENFPSLWWAEWRTIHLLPIVNFLVLLSYAKNMYRYFHLSMFLYLCITHSCCYWLTKYDYRAQTIIKSSSVLFHFLFAILSSNFDVKCLVCLAFYPYFVILCYSYATFSTILWEL